MLTPTERLVSRGESFALRVRATFSDGTTEDVTALAAFGSSESAVVAVDVELLTDERNE